MGKSSHDAARLCHGQCRVTCRGRAAVLLLPKRWPWALGAVAANHVVLTGGGLWPRSALARPDWTRLPRGGARREIAITFDDGPDPEVTPAVLDLLDAREARATFFCIAVVAARHPGSLPRDRAPRPQRGEPRDRHSHAFSLLGPRGMAREIDAAQARLADLAASRRASSRPGRAAQPVARPGAPPARTASW